MVSLYVGLCRMLYYWKMNQSNTIMFFAGKYENSSVSLKQFNFNVFTLCESHICITYIWNNVFDLDILCQCISWGNSYLHCKIVLKIAT